MPKIILKPNEKIEYALRRFKKSCDKAGVIQDYKDHQFHTPKTEKKILKKKEAERREKKRQ